MANYKLSNDASITIGKIYEYSILNFGEKKADEYYSSLHKAFELLAEQPKLGREFYEYRCHEHGEHVFFYGQGSGAGVKYHIALFTMFFRFLSNSNCLFNFPMIVGILRFVLIQNFFTTSINRWLPTSPNSKYDRYLSCTLLMVTIYFVIFYLFFRKHSSR